MLFNPHKLGLHKILKHIPLNAVFDAPYKARLKRAVNIADLRSIAKARAHKVCETMHHNVVIVVDVTLS
jgi:L-lactate dehydrogenase (cytochrome)